MLKQRDDLDAHDHLDPATVHDLVSGRLPSAVALRLVLSILAELCPRCREAIEAAGACHEVTGRLSMERVLRRAQVARLEAPRVTSEMALLEKISDGERRRARVLAAKTRFKSAALAETLRTKAKTAALSGRRLEALEWAALAEIVAERAAAVTPGDGLLEALVRLARAEHANALRVAERYPEADSLLSPLLVVTEDADEPGTAAEILSFGASLRLDQGQFLAAFDLASRAAALFTLAKRRHRGAVALLQVAKALNELGETRGAVLTARTALDQLNPERHRDRLVGVHLLAMLLEESGAVLDALEVVDNHRTLYEQFSQQPAIFGRMLFLHARLAHRSRRLTDAEDLYRRSIEIFRADQAALAAATASLDLAKLLLEQGRTREVRDLAFSMAWLLSNGGLAEEARKALELFLQAATHEALSVEEVRRLCRSFESLERTAAKKPPAAP